MFNINNYLFFYFYIIKNNIELVIREIGLKKIKIKVILFANHVTLKISYSKIKTSLKVYK